MKGSDYLAKISINNFAKKAYERYIAAGMTPEGACGLMGNQYVESAGFIANRVEFLCLKRLKEHGKNYTDESYTAAIDSGKISKDEFMNPLPNKQYGYGISQFTTPARKSGLYSFTVEKGKSIADEDAQLDYVLYELEKSFPKTLNILKTAKSVKEASDYVLVHYECPADTGTKIKNTRADYAQQYYEYFANRNINKEGVYMTKSEAIQKVLTFAEGEVGYLEKKSNAKLDSKTENAGSNNYTKYWRDVFPQYQGQPWCACFVTYVLQKVFGKDMAKKLLKHYPFVYCPTLGNLHTKNSNPKVGDIVLFYRNGTFAHTGIVTNVSGDRFWTIEGNASGASGITPNGGGVVKKSYYNSKLPGTKFVTLDWSLVSTAENSKPTNSTTNQLNDTEKWKGYVTDSAKVRKWAGTNYDECSFSPLKKGDVVSVLDTVKASKGADWYYIRFNGKTGFVHSKYVSQKPSGGSESISGSQTNTSSSNTSTPYMVKITASALNIRKGAGTQYEIAGVIKDKGTYTIIEEKNGWGRLKSGMGWISLKYTEKI